LHQEGTVKDEGGERNRDREKKRQEDREQHNELIHIACSLE